MATKRYILFGGEEFYYASGGSHDFIQASDNKDELIELGEKRAKERYQRNGLAWWHLFDMEEEKIIAGSNVQAHGANNLWDADEGKYDYYPPDDECLD